MVIEYDEVVAAMPRTLLLPLPYRQVGVGRIGGGVTTAMTLHFLVESAILHSMTESAMSLREQRRWETSRRITLCAQELTGAHGLDGFTMDELAEAADVSRRTLFNYFPSKIDAVLGAAPDIPEAAFDAFRAGGPHGNLVDDLTELVRIATSVTQPEREHAERARRILAGESRLLAAAHQRFETITIEFTELVLEREGADFGHSRARLLLRLMLGLLDVALERFTDESNDRSLIELFEEQVREARTLLA
jgi:AcrR family transcriptional regulator